MTNKPSWQTEFDEMYQHITNEKNRLIYRGYQYVTVHACIKAFIQDLLDKKAREIERLKRPGKCDGVTCYCDGEPEDDCEIFEWNSALDQALSILKERV